MSESDVLKDYLEMRFNGLEKIIDIKFQAVGATQDACNTTVTDHETRISSLEKWRAYVLGAAAVIGFMVGAFWCKIF